MSSVEIDMEIDTAGKVDEAKSGCIFAEID